MEVNVCRHKWVDVISTTNIRVSWCYSCGRVTKKLSNLSGWNKTSEYEIGSEQPVKETKV